MEMSRIRPAAIDEATRWAFIVGAPRCGTTSLSKYLKAHPQVAFSRVKEPHFFSAKDMRALPSDELRDRVSRDYLDRYFAGADPRKCLAEGSVSYLYAPERLDPVLRLWPKAKFIICLRNPIDLLASLHRRLFVIGDEIESDFRRAWELVAERRAGRSVPKTCIDSRFLDYPQIGSLGKHVERFLATIGRDRCFISLFDDFCDNPAGQYRKILHFLGLEDDGRTDFEQHRKSFEPRFPALQRLLKRPPKSVASLLANPAYSERLNAPKLPSPVATAILRLRKRVLDWNQAPPRQHAIDDDLRLEMQSLFRDDVALLSQVVGRDLNHWVNG
jgi:hypothetical protein